MFWRAFVPAPSVADVDELPAWFLSFDGQRFLEVSRKPCLEDEARLKVLWQVMIYGPKKMRRGQSRQHILPPMIVERTILARSVTIETVGVELPV